MQVMESVCRINAKEAGLGGERCGVMSYRSQGLLLAFGGY
jgi:hypothetical protein